MKMKYAHLISFLCLMHILINKADMPNNWNPSLTHKQNFSVIYKAALNTLSNFSFTGNEIVLDINCRDGSATNLIAQHIPAGMVYGIDTSKEMTLYAQEKYASHSNMQFLNTDITSLNRDASFDIITLFFSLNWNPDTLATVSNATRVLKENGVLIATVASSENNLYYQTRVEILKTDKWKSYFVNYSHPAVVYTEQELYALIKKTPLQVQTLKTKKNPFTFKDKNEFIAWMNTIKVNLDRLPTGLHQEFINDVADLYMQKSLHHENTPIELYLPYIVVMAKKPSNTLY
jgi:trans-aconitate methyltransferase